MPSKKRISFLSAKKEAFSRKLKHQSLIEIFEKELRKLSPSETKIVSPASNSIEELFLSVAMSKNFEIERFKIDFNRYGSKANKLSRFDLVENSDQLIVLYDGFDHYVTMAAVHALEKSIPVSLKLDFVSERSFFSEISNSDAIFVGISNFVRRYGRSRFRAFLPFGHSYRLKILKKDVEYDIGRAIRRSGQRLVHKFLEIENTKFYSYALRPEKAQYPSPLILKKHLSRFLVSNYREIAGFYLRVDLDLFSRSLNEISRIVKKKNFRRISILIDLAKDELEVSFESVQEKINQVLAAQLSRERVDVFLFFEDKRIPLNKNCLLRRQRRNYSFA